MKVAAGVRLLGALVVLGAIVLVGFWMSGARDDESTDAAAPSAPASASAEVGEGASEVDEVRLESLEPAGVDEPTVRRNPFRFGVREESTVSAGPEAAPAPIARPQPVGPPPVPPIPLRFIGVMDAPMPTGQVAVLSDGRGNVFNGRAGDVIEGRYRVVSVSTTAVELSYLDGRGRQTLRLPVQ